MKHSVIKAYFDYEKEEKYLNEMSAKGLALTDYSFCRYVFEDAPKGEYIYRLELLENAVNHPESQIYIKFMEETGAEFVASYNRWVYFRRKNFDGEFNIYSDIDSKIKHYKRIRELFFFVMGLNFIIGLMNYFWGNMTASSIRTIPVNSYMAILSFLISTLFLIFLVIPLSKKINFWEKEKEIRE
ncbi:MAG: DUF2812 domain-containing protein [Clostridiaceae bacterium]